MHYVAPSYSLLSHLSLLEVVADFRHERSIVSSLHSELFVFKAEAATARLAFPIHRTVCEDVVHIDFQ